MAQQVVNYKCPACTGPMHFVGQSGKLECDYCGSSYSVAEVEALYAEKEHSAEAAAAKESAQPQWNTDAGAQWTDDEASGLRVYNCPSCGAEIMCDESTAATSCLYCGNPTVIPGQLGGSVKPDYVIPFRLDKEAAIAALKKHYKGKRLLPKAFATENRIQEIKGVYVPFWLFDCQSHGFAQYDAELSTTHTEGDYEVTVTDHYTVFREGNISFQKIPVDGSSKMPDAHMDAIEPFDYSQLTAFSTAYLPGFLADKYDVDAQTSVQRVNERVQASTEDMLASTVTGYSSVAKVGGDVSIAQGQVKYALMPVWLLNSQWKGKTYTFAMNGQTGKLIGDLPISWGKFFAWFFGIWLGLAIPLSLISMFLM